MNIIADGYERYVFSNPGKICRARRLVLVKVCRAYQHDLEKTNVARRVYLKCKRWLELRRELSQLDQDLANNLYLNSSNI
jgi:hypothetical protein